MELAPLLLAQGLRNEGHQVSIWADPSTFLGKKITEGHWPFHPFHFRGYFNPRSILEIRRALSKARPDLIHLHHSRDLAAVVLALKLNGWEGPVVLTKHVASDIQKKDFIHRWLYRRLDFMLTCSTFIRENVLKTCPIPPAKVAVSYMGVDLKRFKYSSAARGKLRSSWGWDKNIVIGMVARITPRKGHELFLRIAAKLIQKDPRVRFRVAGQYSPKEKGYYRRLLALRKRLGLENVVFFDDHVEEIQDFFSAFDLVLHTAEAESFGMAVVEAMACGCPVVVRRGGGVAEVLETASDPAKGGVVMDNGDPESWAQTLSTLLRSEPLMGKLKGETRRMVSRFSLDFWVDHHLGWYRQLLEAKRRPVKGNCDSPIPTAGTIPYDLLPRLFDHDGGRRSLRRHARSQGDRSPSS
jgi:D-inositol-3-phosphate glycosyltransferase